MKIQIELSDFEVDVLLLALRNQGLGKGGFGKTCEEVFRKINDELILRWNEQKKAHAIDVQLMTELDEPPSV